MHRHRLLRALIAASPRAALAVLLGLAVLLALAPACAPAGPHADAPCADLRGVRACWDEHCAGGMCVVPRATPAASGRFECSGEPAVCVQRFPRRPDDGEWECVDLDGIVLCRGGEPAAGVVAGPADRGWICRGDGKRHCVDLAPDRPEGEAMWRCRFESAREGARVCERSVQPGVGDRCAAGVVCPADMRCVSSVCVPTTAPAPSCWLDRDCGPGKRCVRGTCA